MGIKTLLDSIQTELQGLNGAEVGYGSSIMEGYARRLRTIVEASFGENTLERETYFRWIENIMSNADYYDRWGYSEDQWLWQGQQFLSVVTALLDQIDIDPTAFIEGTTHVSRENRMVNTGRSQQVVRVFVVHGHDVEMKEAVARCLHSLQFVPIILHEQPNRGKVIIEKIEDYSDVKFAVVILSPDDMGFAVTKSSDAAKTRARQNVIFEFGYFVGKLGRQNVFVLFRNRDDFDLPSDVSGIVYVPYDSYGRWRLELAKELQGAGFNVDFSQVI